jgi:Uma2 family endonuclease
MCAIEYYTYDDYKIWEGDWELINGQPISMAPAPVRKHQGLAGKILTSFTNQIQNCKKCEVLGEEDWKISEDTVVRPDVSLICDEPNEFYITKAPEIVVEIISKSTAKKDETYKFDLYEKEKVPYYIIVYPDDLKAKVFKLLNGKYDKQGDFSKECYEFKEIACEVTLDFDKVFERYR